MYETMMTRHSSMLIGPTGGGKTVVIEALVDAQAYLGLPTKMIILNPKVFLLFILPFHCRGHLLPSSYMLFILPFPVNPSIHNIEAI